MEIMDHWVIEVELTLYHWYVGISKWTFQRLHRCSNMEGGLLLHMICQNPESLALDANHEVKEIRFWSWTWHDTLRRCEGNSFFSNKTKFWKFDVSVYDRFWLVVVVSLKPAFGNIATQTVRDRLFRKMITSFHRFTVE